MQRRFNYTDRARLLHSDASFSVKEGKDGPSFEAALDLSGYNLDSNASVFVEAYRQTSWMRFEWGTVGNLKAPADRFLKEFDSVDDIRFRVRVTSCGDESDARGLLLAEADKVKLSGSADVNDNSESLLPVLAKDLGDEMWQLSFDDDKTRLIINEKCGTNHKRLARHPLFVSLVYPSAVRQILKHIIFTLRSTDYDDLENHYSRWLRFAVDTLRVGEPPDDEDGADDWIEDAVASFSTKHSLLLNFTNAWEQEDSE